MGRIKPESQDIEFRLRERERFLRTLIANLPGVVFRCRTDENFTKEFVSDGCFDLTGYRAEEIVGAKASTNWKELMHPEDRERVFDELRRLIESGQPVEAEQFQISYRLIARNQQLKHVRDRFRFVHDSLLKTGALEGFITDITDQTLADERVRESENRYKLLAENMRDLVCLLDLEGKYLYVSPSSETLLGYTPDELVATIKNILSRVSRTHTRVALAANANSAKPVFLLNDRALPNNVNPDNLTEAEERIARLVAESLSNKEIAARLDVSIRTVESHVSHILSKKGFSNRVEIARYIVDQTAA